MGKIFRFIWKLITKVRVATFNILFLLFVVFIVVGILSVEQPEPIGDNIPLLVAPSGILVDKKTYEATPIELLAGQNQGETETQVRDLVDAILAAAEDKRISSLILKLDNLYGGGLSKLEEIGQAIEQFKASGKPVYAYAESYSQQQYYLASYADKIYLHNMGSVFLTGYGMYRNYMKDAADKLSVKFHVFRVGEYKDAIENFVRNDMSEESREHNMLWINELWQRYTDKVENSRQLPKGAVESFILSLSETSPAAIDPQTNAELAFSAGLVDSVTDKIQLKQTFIEQFGETEQGGFPHVRVKRYLQDINNPLLQSHENQIGLIVAQGPIVDGDAPNNTIGSSTLNQLLHTAREDEDISAIVIRVNSGGGSSFASEIIREQIEDIQNSGTPVFISMGSMAASGGYWISTPAEEIWATPSTITGSIGVWGLVPNFTDSLNKLGIYSDGVGTTPLSDVFQPDRKMSEAAQTLFQRNVENIYSRFLQLVSEARSQDIETIHQVAQGRVWTGQKAKELGLLDNIGTLKDVLDRAAEVKGYSTYNVKEIELPLTTQEQIIRSLMEETSSLGSKIRAAFWGEELELAAKIKALLEHSPINVSSFKLSEPTVYAQCLECIDIEQL